MTTKYLSGAYGGGYSLNTASFSGLTLLQSATAGTLPSSQGYGSYYGVSITGQGAAAETLTNYGRIVGKDGAVFSAAGSIKNAGTIDGQSVGILTSQVYAATITNSGLIEGGDGVYLLKGGGSLTNGASGGGSALIEGQTGVGALAGTVVNFTTILGDNTFGFGVSLAAANLVNGSGLDTTALVRGAIGVTVASGSVVNFGTIDGAAPPVISYGSIYGGAGVRITGGGSLTNGAGTSRAALIEGYDGVGSTGVEASVINFGTIIGLNPVGGAGVNFLGGGTVQNGGPTDATALIEGYGGVILGAAGTVTNYADITGLAGTGVLLESGGEVDNGMGADRSAQITGLYGVRVGGAAGLVINQATIIGEGSSAGVQLLKGGQVFNGSATDALALIEGYGGVSCAGAGASFNFGTILALGVGRAGVMLSAGATLANGSTSHRGALIDGYYGVDLRSGASKFTNFGTVIGEGGVAVELTAATDTLVVESGSTFVGQILGGGGTLELGSGMGTLTSLLAGGNVTVSGSMATTTFTNFGTVKIDAGASFALAGTGGTIATGQALSLSGTLSGTGTLSLTGGTSTFGTGASLTIAKVSESGAASASFTATALTVSDVWTQTAGTVTVATGDRVNFAGAGNAFSGTLAGAGTVDFTGGTDALTGTTLSATLMVVNGAAVSLSGTINLTKTLDATSPTVTIAAAGVTLSGKGTLYLNAATSIIKGATTATMLTNLDDRIIGTGQLGDGQLKLVNGGTIDGSLTTALTINTGANAVANTGVIECTNTGGTTITGAVINTGTITVTKGTLRVKGAVTGTGTVRIGGGTADFGGTFTQNVDFYSTTGVLELARSATYTGQITGLSTTGKSSLDLLDITFGSKTTATFSGSSTSGVLTVTDGTHTAKITLEGAYLGHTFTASSDGHGGTTVVDPSLPKSGGHVSPLVAAMAGFGAGGGTILVSAPPNRTTSLALIATPA